MCVCIYIYIYMCVCVYIYIYILYTYIFSKYSITYIYWISFSLSYIYIHVGFSGLPRVKNSPAMQERQKTAVLILGGEDPLEAIHSSTFAWRIWRILCIVEPGGLQSTGSQSQTYWSDSAQVIIFKISQAREVGGGFRMGNTCKSMSDSCQCMAKTTTIL